MATNPHIPIHKAPRLKAYLDHSLFRKSLYMSRIYWDLMKQNLKHTFEIDIYKTPLKNTTISSTVLGCIATNINLNIYELKVYRIDPKDDPPFNVDTYTLYEHLPSVIDFPKVVLKSSTDINNNMIDHLKEVVFIANNGPQDDHHSTYDELPYSIQKKYQEYKKSNL